jgi:diaminohydroxyphosphoribosylaminopyrimidine deaminase/5-amino-6-(5-phosphoribosylamino)uracil reductase
VSAIDLRFLDRALALAERGRPGVSPNPMVGSVLVRAGRIVGEGFHRRAGGPHAEIEAIRAAGPRAKGADLYVTLEPCNHVGRTGPCVDAIARAGIARVIVALRDPNPQVRGGGMSALRAFGVRVARGDPERARRAARQNEKFLTWATRGRPFVLLKWASSLDGRIADAGGRSRWITSERARRRALLLREEHDAVLVGAGTVLADDPLLTRRLGRNREPHVRVVLDGRLRIPERARVLRDPGGVIVVAARGVNPRKRTRLRKRGVEVWELPANAEGRVALRPLLRRLAGRGVTSLLVEGGGETHAAFLEARLADRICAFLAPRILGGAAALSAVGGPGFALSRAPALEDVEIERIGGDIIVRGAPVFR